MKLTPDKTRLLWAAAVTVVLLIVYRHSFTAPFIYDDHHVITNNPHIRSLSTAFAAPRQSTLSGRPVVSLSLAVNFKLGQLDPRGYHAFNLAVHLINTLLLFGIVRRALRSDGWAMCVATAWALHPLQTEAVVYVIQRTELMMAMFYLATLYAAIRAFQSQRPTGWCVAAVVACALGMACKEVMISAPLIVLLYDRLFHRSGIRQRPRFYAALAATWLGLGALIITGSRSDSIGYDHDITAWEYLRTQAAIIWHYLRLCIWPAGLTIRYDWPIARLWHENLVHGAALAALLAASVYGVTRRRWPAALLGIAFFAILAPTSSVIPIVSEVAAERRMYLPLAAVIIGIALIFRRFSRESVVTAVLAILILATVTDTRVWDYRSALSIWEDAVAKSPRSEMAHSAYGQQLILAGQIQRGIDHLQQADALNERNPVVKLNVYTNLSIAYLKAGDWEQAIAASARAIQFAPQRIEGYGNLGIALRRAGNLDGAEEVLARGLALQPHNPHMQYHMGMVKLQTGRPVDAEKHARAVIAFLPRDAPAYELLGSALATQGRLDEAIRAFQTVLSIDPQHKDARDKLDRALQESGAP